MPSRSLFVLTRSCLRGKAATRRASKAFLGGSWCPTHEVGSTAAISGEIVCNAVFALHRLALASWIAKSAEKTQAGSRYEKMTPLKLPLAVAVAESTPADVSVTPLGSGEPEGSIENTPPRTTPCGSVGARS